MSTIFFPAVEPIWDYAQRGVCVYAVIDRKPTPCWVDGEALVQFFGAKSVDPVECTRAFAEHRSAIEHAIRDAIKRANGLAYEVFLTKRDFLPEDEQLQEYEVTEAQVAPEIQANPAYAKCVSQLLGALDHSAKRASVHVVARWTLHETPNEPLLHLLVTDVDADVEAQQLFDPQELTNELLVPTVAAGIIEKLMYNRSAKHHYQLEQRQRQESLA